jgi:protein-tyrosine-phosphatase
MGEQGMNRVIFACVHNAGRSQMAAAFFNAIAARDKAQAVSAGTQPADRLHPEVLAVMREVGIDLSNARPQKPTDELAQDATMLVTLGCGDEFRMSRAPCVTIGRSTIPRVARSRTFVAFVTTSAPASSSW